MKSYNVRYSVQQTFCVMIETQHKIKIPVDTLNISEKNLGGGQKIEPKIIIRSPENHINHDEAASLNMPSAATLENEAAVDQEAQLQQDQERVRAVENIIGKFEEVVDSTGNSQGQSSLDRSAKFQRILEEAMDRDPGIYLDGQTIIKLPDRLLSLVAPLGGEKDFNVWILKDCLEALQDAKNGALRQSLLNHNRQFFENVLIRVKYALSKGLIETREDLTGVRDVYKLLGEIVKSDDADRRSIAEEGRYPIEAADNSLGDFITGLMDGKNVPERLEKILENLKSKELPFAEINDSQDRESSEAEPEALFKEENDRLKERVAELENLVHSLKKDNQELEDKLTRTKQWLEDREQSIQELNANLYNSN